MLDNKNIINKVTGFAFLTSMVFLTSCQNFNPFANLNNPFYPKAELTITDVKPTESSKGVGIFQTFKRDQDVLIANYKYNEPTITIENKKGLPRVIFKKIFIENTAGGKKLPAQVYPIAITIPSGGSFSGTIPTLGNSEDLVTVVYPNNSLVSVPSGFSEATLLGLDDNGYAISLKFSTTVKFETDPTGYSLPKPTPSPSQASSFPSIPQTP